MVKITQELLRSRLGELRDTKSAIEKKMAPLDKQREEILANLQPLEEKLRKLDAKRAEVRGPLFDVDNEISTIVRLMPTDRSVPAVEVGAAGQEPSAGLASGDEPAQSVDKE